MCLTVQNLFNNKDVILSREDILEVVKYALQEYVVCISFDDTCRNSDYGIDGQDIQNTDYSVSLNGDEDENNR